MNYISIKYLKALRACGEQTQKFRETFGNSVKFDSLEEAQELALKYAKEFDFERIGQEVFGEAYQEAEATLWKAYEDAKAPLLKAYEEAEAPLWEVYKEAKAPLWKAYQEAESPLLKTYLEGCAKLFAEMWWELQKDFQVK